MRDGAPAQVMFIGCGGWINCGIDCREGSEDAVTNHLLVKHPYCLEAERTRRNACDAMFKKTGKQEQEDTQVCRDILCFHQGVHSTIN